MVTSNKKTRLGGRTATTLRSTNVTDDDVVVAVMVLLPALPNFADAFPPFRPRNNQPPLQQQQQ
jgi:hypothetical protein